MGANGMKGQPAKPVRGAAGAVKAAGAVRKESETTGRPNTLGLRRTDLETVLNELDAGPSGAGSKRRNHARWAFRQESLELRLVHPGSAHTVSIKVACRNLSCGGLSALHSAYVHPGTKVTAIVPHPLEGGVPVPGEVVRCQHVRGMIHEIGVKFVKPIAAREFVKNDPFAEAFSFERVNPADLHGTVLHVEDSPLDQRLVRHYLRDTALRIKQAGCAEEAMAEAANGCDLVLCDCDMPGMHGPELVEHLRAAGIRAPVVMVTADTSPGTQQRIAQARVDACLAKPLRQDVLLRAIAEFLLSSQPAAARRRATKFEGAGAALAEAFVEELRELARRLESAVQSGDAKLCRLLSVQIKGSAPAYGHESLASLASDAIVALDKSPGSAETARLLQGLLTGVRRVASHPGE